MDRILPPQATTLERAIVNVTPRWDLLAEAAEGVSGFTPGEFKPWTAGELGLSQFAPYFETLDQLIAEGRRWIFERGTAAGVMRVLGWLGYHSATIEEDGFFLHLDLGRVATPLELEQIRHVVLATLPAHMKFYRVFFAHDLRPIRLDHGPALDVGLLDNDSGVWTDPDGVKASFSITHTGTTTAPPTLDVDCAYTQTRYALITYDDRALLDSWQLDSQVLLDAYGGLSELFTGTTTAPAPGSPERANGEGRIGLVPWHAPEPEDAETAYFTGTGNVPVSPPRRWRGPWAGRWRTTFELKKTEET